MATYTVRNRDTDTVHTVEAESHAGAALLVYRNEYRRRRGRALRTTGQEPLSGVFAIYQPVGHTSPGTNERVGPDRGYHVLQA